MGAGLWVVALVGGAFLVLFLGGMLHAAWEIRQERKAGKPVTRPGWHRAKNCLDDDCPHAEKRNRPNYNAPRGTWFVIFPLTMIGRADVAERYMARRIARRGGAHRQGVLPS